MAGDRGVLTDAGRNLLQQELPTRRQGTEWLNDRKEMGGILLAQRTGIPGGSRRSATVRTPYAASAPANGA